jgi:hypothetical protein
VPDFWIGLVSSAAYYKRNKKWIEENVKDPFDYLAIDHSDVDRELVINGIDHGTFWNIWRLAPTVYRHKTGDWHVRVDHKALNSNEARTNAPYVLENTIDIVLNLHRRKNRLRYAPSSPEISLTLKREGVNVYEKADKQSHVIRTTPPGLLTINASYCCPGLRDDDFYWKVFHLLGQGSVLGLGGNYIAGFIVDDEIKPDHNE